MRDKRQESRVESRPAEQAPPLNGPRAGVAPTPDSRLLTPSRRGVTLVELMITIMIISILAAAVLGVAAVAGETAREAKTRNVVARLHTLLMEQYGTYASRRIKLQSSVVNSINALNANSAVKGRLRAEARLYALREMILMEVPDRWSDVLLNSVPSTPSSAVACSRQVQLLVRPFIARI